MNEIPHKGAFSLQTLVSLWKGCTAPQRVVILSAVLGLISPFFNWFHSCNRIPGNYNCITWNGFQWDNDIYGLFIFVLSAAALISVIFSHTGTRYPLPVGPQKIQLVAGILLILLGLYRLVSFKGEDTVTTAIGPSMGLLFVIIAGAGLALANYYQYLIAMILNARRVKAPLTKQEPVDDLDAMSDDAFDDGMHDLFDTDAEAGSDDESKQRLQATQQSFRLED